MKKTITTTEFGPDGKPTKITVEETEDNGPVGPSDLPRDHKWWEPRVYATGTNVSPADINSIINGTDAVRVTGE